jgi:hypothetical protein
MTDITDIGADAAQESEQTSNNDGYESTYERYDLDGVQFGKQHPASAIRGTAVGLRQMYDENDPDRADVSVMLTEPSIVTSANGLDQTRVVTSEEESDDFKVVNLADEQTAALGPGGKIDDPADIDDESDLMGIDFAGNTFYGDVGTTFDTDEGQEIALKRGGGAGRSITSVLDVNGGQAATTVEDDNGDPVLHDGGFPQHNGGLIEYHPDGRDGERPRYARDPQLRDDVEGQDVVIMIQRLSEVDPDYDGTAYWATVFADLSDAEPQDSTFDSRSAELAEQYASESEDKAAEDFLADLDGDTFVRLKPTTAFEPDDDLLRESGYISWQRPGLDELNEAREAEGFDPYQPDQSDGSGSDEAENTA